MVRTSSSTPDLAKMRHIPLSIPDMDAYDIAIHVRGLRIREFVSGEPSRLLSRSKGVRSVGGVCSRGDSGTGGSVGDSGRETTPVGRRYSARCVYVERRINGHTDGEREEWETYDDQYTKNSEPKKREVNNKDMSAKKSEEIVKGVRRFRYNAKYGNEDRACGNEEGTDKHVVRKYVA